MRQLLQWVPHFVAPEMRYQRWQRGRGGFALVCEQEGHDWAVMVRSSKHEGQSRLRRSPSRLVWGKTAVVKTAGEEREGLGHGDAMLKVFVVPVRAPVIPLLCTIRLLCPLEARGFACPCIPSPCLCSSTSSCTVLTPVPNCAPGRLT